MLAFNKIYVVVGLYFERKSPPSSILTPNYPGCLLGIRGWGALATNNPSLFISKN
jgi:hypothetical protein